MLQCSNTRYPGEGMVCALQAGTVARNKCYNVLIQDILVREWYVHYRQGTYLIVARIMCFNVLIQDILVREWYVHYRQGTYLIVARIMCFNVLIQDILVRE